jgi:hypothetical protein
MQKTNILRKPLTWCILLALLVQFLFIPLRANRYAHADATRYIAQAERFLAGQGYGDEVNLPPGYPLFLAAVFAVCGRMEHRELVVWALHNFMAVASYCLVYAAIRPRSQRAALFAFLLLLTASAVTQFSGGIMSETLTGFWMAALVYQISRLEIGAASWRTSLAIGVLCVAMLLTAPATAFLAFAFWLYAAYRGWKTGTSPISRNGPQGASQKWVMSPFSTRILVQLAGSLLLMIPWQIHCYRASGSVQPAVYKPMAAVAEGRTLWIRTWATRQSALNLFALRDAFKELPDGIFASAEQRRQLQKCNDVLLDYRDERQRAPYPAEWLAVYERELRDGYAAEPPRQAHAEFARVAAQRIAADPWRFYFVLPLVRTTWAWFRPSPADFTMDSLKGAAAVMALNAPPLFMALLLVLGAVYGIRRRSLLPLLIVAGMAAYTCLGAWSAMGEFRRTVVFYPAIAFLLFYLAGWKTGTSPISRNGPQGASQKWVMSPFCTRDKTSHAL